MTDNSAYGMIVAASEYYGQGDVASVVYREGKSGPEPGDVMFACISISAPVGVTQPSGWTAERDYLFWRMMSPGDEGKTWTFAFTAFTEWMINLYFAKPTS
jgi:hypothetical protein